MIDLAASLEATSRQHASGCVKIHEDLDRYKRIIDATKPDLIVECGTFSGKSALWFARAAQCRVITIDTTPYIDPDTAEFLAEHDVVQLVGSSIDIENIDLIEWYHDQAERVMVVLDSDHSADHVMAEMLAYGHLVTPGCFMVVEDTLLRHMPAEERKHYRGNPWDAVDDWLKMRDDWVIDRDVENMHPVTQFPDGWLRKVAPVRMDVPGLGGVPDAFG